MKALEFRVTGIPVRVEPVFFLIMGLLGFANSQTGIGVAVFMVVGGVSILLHELGHATAHRSFGAHPRVTLTGFGGVTVGPAHPRGRSLVVTLAGPIAGFVAALVGVALSHAVTSPSTVVSIAIDDLIWVNIVWGVFNLLPILPLDGGNVASDLFGARTARFLSVAGSVGLGLIGLYTGQIFLAFLAFYFGTQSLNALRFQRDRPQLERLDDARAALLRGDTKGAVEILGPVAAAPGSFPVEVTAAELLTWARLADNQPEEARAALATLRGGATRTSQLVQRSVELANGETTAPLAQAWVLCDDIVAAMIAARVVIGADALDRVIEELNGLPKSLPGPPKTNGYRALQLGLHHAGRFREAARVGDLLFFQDPAPLVAYNVACSWALAGETEEALAWLDRAVEKGFRDSALLDQDNNFDSIRDTDGFRALRSWMESGPTGDDPAQAAGGAG
jgi:Zn-dependent protease